MDQNTKNKILDAITRSESILIVVARDLNFDGLASGLALYLSLIKLDKNVSILAQEPTVAEARRLYSVDKVGKTEGSEIPTIVVENAVETVDKVTYYLDGTKLKVIIHPLPGTSQIAKNQISVEYTSRPADLIFAIGQTSLHDLRSDIAHEQQINPDSLIIAINNQNMSQKFAQIDFIDLQAASVSEVCAQLIQEFALPMDEDIAYNLYTALSISSQNFAPTKTTEKTLNIAAWLIKFGAGRASFARDYQPPAWSKYETQASLQSTSQSNMTIHGGYSQSAARSAQPSSISQPKQPTSPPQIPDDLDIFKEIIPPTKPSSKDWLKPPKIYKGSKSFDGEN